MKRDYTFGIFKEFFILFSFILFHSQLMGQADFVLSGEVKDNTGNGLELAKVTIQNGEDGDTLGHAYTNDAGEYAAVLDVDIEITGIDEQFGEVFWSGNIKPNPASVATSQVLIIPFRSPSTYAGKPEVELYDMQGKKIYPGFLSTGNYLYRIRYSPGVYSKVKTLSVVFPGSYIIELENLSTFTGNRKKSSTFHHFNPAYFQLQNNVMAQVVEEFYMVVEKDGYVTNENGYEPTSEEAMEVDIMLEEAALPTASFETLGSYNVGEIVYFDASSSLSNGESALVYSWEFGNAQRGGGEKIPHVYMNPGEYTVKLTVAGEYNAVHTHSKTITINDIPEKEYMVDIAGRVFNMSGDSLPGANVQVIGTEISGLVDNAGDVLLNEVPPLGTITLRVTKENFAPRVVTLKTNEDTRNVYFETTLIERGNSYVLANAELGGEKTDETGTKIELPVDALEDESGNTIKGDVNITFTPVDVSTDEGYNAFPGAFEGITPDGPADLILSFGTSEIVLEQDGDELQLKPGKCAFVELPLHVTKHADGSDVQVGDEIPIWSLNEETGIWVNEGMGTVINSDASPTGFALRGDITHLSWWNIDVAPNPYSPTLYGVPGGSGGGSGGPSNNPPDNPIPVTVTGTPMGGGGPMGGPRNSSVGPNGTNLPMPPDVDIRISATANNGTSRGTILINGTAGDTGILIIPVFPVGRGSGGNLACDSLYSATIDPVDEKDSWSFNATKNSFVEITLKATTGSNLEGTAVVIAPSGARIELGTFTGSTTIQKLINLPETGDYVVIVDGTKNEPGAYDISMACAKTLVVNTAQKDTVNSTGALFAFQGEEGKLYNLAFQGLNLSNTLYFRLEDEFGNRVASTYSSSQYSETGIFKANRTGNFYVRGNGTATGVYEISITDVDSPEMVTLDENILITDTIKELGKYHFYKFEGMTNQYISGVLKHPGSNLNALVEVYEPNSTEEFYDSKRRYLYASTSTSARVRDDDPEGLQQDGEYIISVKSSNGILEERTGVYQLELFVPDPIPLSLNTNRLDTIEEYGFQLYTYSGTPGEILNVATLGENLSNTIWIDVKDKNRTRVNSSYSSKNFTETNPFKITQSDTYFIIVNGNYEASGEFNLGFSRIEEPVEITLGSPFTEITDTIEILGDHQFFSFNASQNEVFSYVMEHESGFLNGYGRVFEPKVNEFYTYGDHSLGIVSTSSSNRISDVSPMMFPETTDYIFMMRSQTGNNFNERTGVYNLIIHKPEPVALDVDTNVTANLEERAFNLFTFTGSSDLHVNVAHLGTSLNGSIYARVKNSNRGNVESSYSSGNFSETEIFAASDPSTYYVIIDGNSDASGEYIFGLSEIEEPSVVSILDGTTTISDSITVLGDHVFYSFDGNMNEILNFVVDHPSGNLTARMAAYEPSSSNEFYKFGSSNLSTASTNNSNRIGEITPRLLPKTTDYVIEVESYTGNFNERHGEFQITVNKPIPVSLSGDNNYDDTISEYSFDVFTYDGNIGEVLNIAHLGSSLSGSINTRVYNSTRNQVESSYSAGNGFSETAPFLLNSGDTYYVIVDGTGDVSGAYKLGFALLQEPTTLDISSLPVTQGGDIQVLGDYHYYQFAGTSGDNVEFLLSHPTGLLNGEVRVFQPESTTNFFKIKGGTGYVGNVFTYSSNRSGTTGEKTLPVTGDYIIRMDSYTGNNYSERTGEYSIEIK